MAGRFRTRGLGRSALVLAAIGAATAFIGVALALVLVQLSGTVSSNEFIPPTTSSTTTTSTIPNGDGLEAAFVQGPFDCQPGIPSGALTLGASSFDLNSTSSSQSAQSPNVLCARNAGPGQIANLTLTVSAAVTGEAGCSSAEGTVDPEGADCGQAGELADILQVILDPGPSTDTNCENINAMAVPLGAPVDLLRISGPDPSGTLAQGNMCVWFVSLGFVDGVTDDQKLAASTDTAQLSFDVVGSG
jgi:hypothetical protein